MILSRCVLVLALTGLGYYVLETRSNSTLQNGSAANAMDSAALASRLSEWQPVASPKPHGDGTPQVVAPSATEKNTEHAADATPAIIRHSTSRPLVTQSVFRPSEGDRSQLIPTQITTSPQLIPGRWRAKTYALFHSGGLEKGPEEPWITAFESPDLNWETDGRFVPREARISRSDPR